MFTHTNSTIAYAQIYTYYNNISYYYYILHTYMQCTHGNASLGFVVGFTESIVFFLNNNIK